jgi:hypothetical protein
MQKHRNACFCVARVLAGFQKVVFPWKRVIVSTETCGIVDAETRFSVSMGVDRVVFPWKRVIVSTETR